jgi:hypothetical protein
MTLPITKTRRKRYDGLESSLALQLDAATGTSTVQFDSILKSDGGVVVPALADDEYIALSILDALFVLKEIVYLITYDGTDPVGTITRGEEGTAPWTHAAGTRVVHAPTANDFQLLEDHMEQEDPHPQYTTQAEVDAAIQAHEAKPDPHPQYVKKGTITIAPNDDLIINGDLIINEGARLIVHGDLIIEGNGTISINGHQIIVDDVQPVNPPNNAVWIRTYGVTP